MGLRSKFMLSVALLLTSVLLTVSAMTAFFDRQTLVAEMQQHEVQLVKRLARVCEESLYQNEVGLLNYLKDLRGERAFESAAFLDPKGTVRIHSDPRQIGTKTTRSSPTRNKTVDGVDIRHFVSENGKRLVELIAPIHVGSVNAGSAHIVLSDDERQRFLNAALMNNLARTGLISLVALALGLLGSYKLAETMTLPIHRVVGAMRRIAQGELDPLPPSERKDELGLMTNELNVMIDRLKELAGLKREFIASVTHELRSPLTAIQQFVASLSAGVYGSVNGKQRESLMLVNNNAIRLEGFIDDLLTAAQLEARRAEIFKEKFDLRQLIEETRAVYAPIAADKGLELKVHVPAEPVLINADMEKLGQVFLNLLSNAVKFTQQGHILIEVTSQLQRVRVTIADTGVGIPDEDKPRVFAPFFRLRSASKSTKGTGLGLTIVKGLVDLHGGVIAVEDSPGGGSRFVVDLNRDSAPS